MRSGFTHLVLLVMAFGALGTARAEVRLQGSHGSAGRLTAKILQGPHGPWSPRGTVDARVLNARGDLLGDAAPRLEEGEQGVVAAWLRPRRGQLCIALAGSGSAWQAVTVLGAPDAVGLPLVREAHGGWIVAWQALHASGTARVMAVFVTESSVATPVMVADGWLIRAWGSEAGASLLIQGAGNPEDAELVVFSAIEPPFEPIEWERSRSIDRVRFAEFQGADDDAGVASLLAAWSMEATLRIGGRELRALAWVSDDQTVNAVELDAETGEPMPSTMVSRSERVESGKVEQLLKKAARSLGR